MLATWVLPGLAVACLSVSLTQRANFAMLDRYQLASCVAQAVLVTVGVMLGRAGHDYHPISHFALVAIAWVPGVVLAPFDLGGSMRGLTAAIAVFASIALVIIGRPW